MPKVISLIGIILMGYLIGMYALLQDSAIQAVTTLKQEAGVWAFLILMVDKLLSFILKFKKDKVEQHLETISNESIKQTLILSNVERTTVQSKNTLDEVKGNLDSGLSRQKDIYARFLREPKKARKK